MNRLINPSSPNVNNPYPAYGGLFREEAIMLLRRFYVQENEKGSIMCEPVQIVVLILLGLAPEPKPKKDRQLNTEIMPL